LSSFVTSSARASSVGEISRPEGLAGVEVDYKLVLGRSLHWQVGGLLPLENVRCDRLTAPCVFDGPFNGESSRAYVEQQLLPVLNQGDIVIMDNLGSHRSAAIRRMIKAAGARLWYLPPYSPDLNPIEQTFAKIKHWMRMAQRRTVEDTLRQIGTLVATIEPGECTNYFVNAGYASVKT
jgi:transposase